MIGSVWELRVHGVAEGNKEFIYDRNRCEVKEYSDEKVTSVTVVKLGVVKGR